MLSSVLKWKILWVLKINVDDRGVCCVLLSNLTKYYCCELD
jgi:hypothetical protein